jgi:hypothetical protein
MKQSGIHERSFNMETQATTLPLIPFSLLFAQTTTPTCEGEQTVGAATETQTK